jgi:hypothetical protein
LELIRPAIDKIDPCVLEQFAHCGKNRYCTLRHKPDRRIQVRFISSATDFGGMWSPTKLKVRPLGSNIRDPQVWHPHFFPMRCIMVRWLDVAYFSVQGMDQREKEPKCVKELGEMAQNRPPNNLNESNPITQLSKKQQRDKTLPFNDIITICVHAVTKRPTD